MHAYEEKSDKKAKLNNEYARPATAGQSDIVITSQTAASDRKHLSGN